jgi:predicted acyl esterase
MLFAAGLFVALAVPAQTPPRVTPMTPDVMDKYEQTLPSADFIRREEMVPMRDGTKLYTAIVMKKGAKNAPILLSRSPYDAHHSTHRVASQRGVDILEVMDAEFFEDGYIRVYQDIRGLHRSEGQWVLNRPLAGPGERHRHRRIHRCVRHHRVAGEEQYRRRTARSA